MGEGTTASPAADDAASSPTPCVEAPEEFGDSTPARPRAGTYDMPPMPKGSSLDRIVAGVNVGDPAFDSLPLATLRAIAKGFSPDAHSSGAGVGKSADDGSLSREGSGCPIASEGACAVAGACAAPLLRLPDWADVDRMRRGQTVFEAHCYYFLRAFEIALLWGCRIDRFADVLVRTGYTQSPRVAFLRFRDTARHVCLWCCDRELPGGRGAALRSIAQVRAAHALARRRVSETRACTEGLPVSQYDLAFTLMAFSLIALDGVVNDFKQELSDADIDDYLHLWRVLGHLHGVLDEYNPCNDTEDAVEILKDINEVFFFTGLATRGESAARKLTLTVYEGFATWGAGLGSDLLAASFLQPIERKPFIPLSAVSWMPVGDALCIPDAIGDSGTSASASLCIQRRRRLHVAAALHAAMLDLLSRWPALRAGVMKVFYRMLQWGLVDGHISSKRAESGLRFAASLHDVGIGFVAWLAGPLGPLKSLVQPLSLGSSLGLSGKSCAVDALSLKAAMPDEERRCLLAEWRASFSGFRHTGNVVPLTRLSLLALARRVLTPPLLVSLLTILWTLLRMRRRGARKLLR